MDQDHDPRTQADQHGPTAEPMSPEVRGVLRRRLLTGGAAALPVIVTFGRRSLAQNSLAVSIDCLAKNFPGVPPEAFETAKQMALQRESELGGLMDLVEGLTGQGQLDNAIYGVANNTLVVNAPLNDEARTMDSLMHSGGAVFGIFTDGDGNHLVVQSVEGPAGCFASTGIMVLPDI
ncbi:MAG: hypothetical protein WD673_17305 [Alphaproteobacteria bacterium]